MNSLPARAHGVIRRPRATFGALVATPSWASVLCATTLVTFLCTAGLLRTAVGQQALADQWERTALAFGQPVDDARYAQMEDTAGIPSFGLLYGAATALASGPALAFGLSALVCLGMNRATGRRASYGQVLAVVCHAGVILALRQLIATPIDYVRESLASPTTLVQFFGMLDETSPVARFLGIIDVMVLWWAIVIAIGVGVLYGQPTRRLVLIFAGVYIAVALVAALVMATAGGAA